MTPNEIIAHYTKWRAQFRLAVRGFWSGVAQLFPLGQMRESYSILGRCVACVIICASAFWIGCGQSDSAAAPKTQWADPNKLTPGPIQHSNLTEEQLARVSHLQQVFHDVDPSSLEKWAEDFRRDLNPDSEIKIWENMATAYEAFTASKNLSLDAKQDAYQVVILRSAAPEQDVIAHLKLKVLTEADAKEIMVHFSGTAKPIKVIKQ